MAKKTTKTETKEETLLDALQHYSMWTQDNEKRMHRKGGWNDVTDSYYGKLPDDWPYITKIVDPRIRTSLIEKNARLLNAKLRGRLIPREGSDVVTAQINNSILDYQWDAANDGGSMLSKLSISDMDARLYGTKFGLVKWKYEEYDGKPVFDGNEFYPLDIRDCGVDPAATHIRDAKWFQHRSWEFLEDIEKQSDASGIPMFKNVDVLRRRISEKLDRRSSTRKTEYTSRIKQLRGLEDRVGEDRAYPVVMLVTEYRCDRWITFSPEHDIVLRDIPNPYDHHKIPIVQLRYYPLQDDILGESEVEPVIPLWKSIQATICSYMDEVILKMRPPLKIIENAARIETIEYGLDAQWLVDRQDAVEEMRSGGDSIAYFQTTYQALVSAFNVAMGDMSQGVSAFDQFSKDAKTATEIKATTRQQNVRDEKNQTELARFIKDVMLMWLSNNKQFLFTDPAKHEHVLRIVGSSQFAYFKRSGMDEMEVTNEAAQMISDIIMQNPDMTDVQIEQMYDAAKTPKNPVIENPDEKDPAKYKIKAKMRVDKMGDSAEVSIVPSDLEGIYDYIPDVKSMSSGAGEEMLSARMQAIGLLTQNPAVIQLLAAEGYRPNVKDLLISNFEDTGLKDAERFFAEVPNANQGQGQPNQAGVSQMGGTPQPVAGQALPPVPEANPSVSLQ